MYNGSVWGHCNTVSKKISLQKDRNQELVEFVYFVSLHLHLETIQWSLHFKTTLQQEKYGLKLKWS